MNGKDFTTTILVDKTPQEAFNDINNIPGWWTENVTGSSAKTGDEFEVRFGEVHYSRQRLTAVIPAKKVVWLVTDSKLTFVTRQDEWTGTEVVFDIAERNGKTEVKFTHRGLVPQFECYGGCSGAWGDYINNSLRDYIDTGKGKPTLKA